MDPPFIGLFCSVNLATRIWNFWLAVEEYKNSKPQKMAAKAQQIYNDFVAVEASKEVRFKNLNIYSILFPSNFQFWQASFLFPRI
jgi:hypothetical protein